MESVLRPVECSNFPIRFEIAIPRFQTHFWDTCFKPIFPYQWPKRHREQEISGMPWLSSRATELVLLLSLSSWIVSSTFYPKLMCWLISVQLPEDGRMERLDCNSVGVKWQQSRCPSKARLLEWICFLLSRYTMSRHFKRTLRRWAVGTW